jgi:uncharacterized membrane protein YqjE
MTMNDRDISFRDDGTALTGSTTGLVRSSAAAQADKESLGELFAAASKDFSELVRKEVELAKVELKEEAVATGRAGALLGAGGLIGYQAFLVLLLAIAWLLAEVMPTWAGLLIVAVLAGAGAAVLLMSGKKKLQDLTPPIPNTIETLQEDAQWAKQQLS